ncbi:Z1 domain-containing protein [Dyella kyungheensis]|uniref:Z1 domain-containing protein n=1 Tax=Dyella kyungheensis TaxID=1242174 RepID=UPI003CEEA4A3
MNELESNRIATVLEAVLQGMSKLGPAPVESRVRSELVDREVTGDVDGAIRHIWDVVSIGDPNTPIHSIVASHIRQWDAADASGWTQDTYRLTPERRGLIFAKLKLGEAVAEALHVSVPIAKSFGEAVLIANEHRQWYTDQRKMLTRTYYWSRYERYLREQGSWDETATQVLDESTDKVIQCLSDPVRPEAFPVRGLVVGYVQSGKTANFTAVIAKALDAGYRLVIVLAGTLDSLRFQTQRRLDKELVGREQILRDQEDGQLHEYSGDQDWMAFTSYGSLPNEQGAFDLKRITTSTSDYKKLGMGRDVLRFEKKYPERPLNHSDNLRAASARLIVIKKHPAVINKVISDIRGLKSSLDEVPVLVIDDESDQASVNTVNPKSKSNGGKAEKTRTATNKAIVDLLAMFRRSQYVGYTATPAANALINPGDTEDLFPRDFIELLPRPANYMGVSDFYDFDADFNPLDDEETEKLGYRSNKKAFVRQIKGADDTEIFKKALDTFFLSGAMKLFRAAKDPKLVSVRHHTMLVHRAVQQDAHEDDRLRVLMLLDENGYRKRSAIQRLWKLWQEDFEPVSLAQEPSLARPNDFDELAPFITMALERFETARKRVLIVNGRDDHRDDMPDFDKEDVWNILIGGAKLSRGYTVEGLTISYFLRKAAAADTLMQMGRWFGFRRGYRDLVRLFIGTEVPSGRKMPTDLYEMFESICMDEERFRKRIGQYSKETPPIRPIQVPPLVPMGMLIPTQKNKMYNAQIQMENYGERTAESGRVSFNGSDRALNVTKLGEMLAEFAGHDEDMSGKSKDRTKRSLRAKIHLVDAERFVRFLQGYVWGTRESQFSPVINFLQGTADESPEIDAWLIALLGKPSAATKWKFGPHEIGVFNRAVVGDRYRVFSEARHRDIASHLAGISVLSEPNESLRRFTKSRQGVCLIYPTVPNEFNAVEATDREITLGLSLTFPKNHIPQKINWRVKDPRVSVAFVERDSD